MRTAPTLALLATAIACSLFAAPAQAQRQRVFIASYGNDNNPCTFGSPCKTFQNAVSVVADGGEVTAIDSAGFGPVTITSKSVTITSPNGVEAGIAVPAGQSAITINGGPTDTVVLRGLTLDGSGSAHSGVNFTAGLRLEIYNCVVHNFLGGGISAETAGATSVVISNSVVSDNTSVAEGAVGIFLGTSGSGSIVAALDGVTVVNNYDGVDVLALGGPVSALIANSHVDNELHSGIFASGSLSGSAVSNVVLKNVTLNQTGQVGIDPDQFATAWLSQVTQITGVASVFTPSLGVAFGPSTTAYSDGTNLLMGGFENGTLSTTSQWQAQ